LKKVLSFDPGGADELEGLRCSAADRQVGGFEHADARIQQGLFGVWIFGDGPMKRRPVSFHKKLRFQPIIGMTFNLTLR